MVHLESPTHIGEILNQSVGLKLINAVSDLFRNASGPRVCKWPVFPIQMYPLIAQQATSPRKYTLSCREWNHEGRQAVFELIIDTCQARLRRSADLIMYDCPQKAAQPMHGHVEPTSPLSMFLPHSSRSYHSPRSNTAQSRPSA